MCLIVLLGACSETTFVYRPVGAFKLHGRSVLFLRPSLQSPTGKELHQRVSRAIEAGIAASPLVGPVLRREEVEGRRDLPLNLLRDYQQFSNTLSLTGVSDPEIANRLGRELNVELLSMAQVSHQPCGICEEGDQLWLIGQFVEAETGKIVLRVHQRAFLDSGDEAVLTREGERLAAEYLEEFASAFSLKWHRLRFEQLKLKGGGGS